MGGFGDPAGLDAGGRLLTRDADELRGRARRLAATGSGLGWEGPAAQAFRRALAEDLSAVHRAASGLDEAAQSLHRHATEVRERAADLRELAESVTGWFR